MTNEGVDTFVHPACAIAYLNSTPSFAIRRIWGRFAVVPVCVEMIGAQGVCVDEDYAARRVVRRRSRTNTGEPQNPIVPGSAAVRRTSA